VEVGYRFSVFFANIFAVLYVGAPLKFTIGLIGVSCLRTFTSPLKLWMMGFKFTSFHLFSASTICLQLFNRFLRSFWNFIVMFLLTSVALFSKMKFWIF
jgi:hypothetical protein